MIWNIRKEKNNQSGWREEKRIQKITRILLLSCGTALSNPTFASEGCQREKRKSKKLEIYLKK